MNIGQKVIAELRREISQKEYERYFSSLIYDPENSRSDLAIFHAPNIFSARWIRTNYSETISHLFEIKTGIKPEIEIYIGKNFPSQEKNILKPEESKSGKNTLLNPSFTFDSFIVGSSNQFAYTTALSVAEKPGRQYNPLFIYGGVGLGKTHLLQAIGNHRCTFGDRIIYTTLEQFMIKFISHVRSGTMERFHKHFRECDLLLIDDIQFLSRKEQTQDEFFHTFNELHSAGKQIVMTSDRPPKKIAGLEERLRTRFEWGLMADIQPPELETKIAIIQKKCELDGIDLDTDISPVGNSIFIVTQVKGVAGRIGIEFYS